MNNISVGYGYVRLQEGDKVVPGETEWRYRNCENVWQKCIIPMTLESSTLERWDYRHPIDVGQGYRLLGENETFTPEKQDECLYLSGDCRLRLWKNVSHGGSAKEHNGYIFRRPLALTKPTLAQEIIECKERLARLEERAKEAAKPKLRVGMYILSAGYMPYRFGGIYVLAMVDKRNYCLINILSGVRWDDPVTDIEGVFGRTFGPWREVTLPDLTLLAKAVV